MAQFPATIDLATLDGSNGFRLDGIDAYDRSGRSVASAGDVNGDGFADLIVGASVATPAGTALPGRAMWCSARRRASRRTSTLPRSTARNGFTLSGVEAYDQSGRSVASAGDVNGDGFADLIVGAYGGDPGGDSYAGESYVVFGKAAGFAANLDLSTLDGTNGFKLGGVAADDQSGGSVASAGDVNGDGFADLIVGAHRCRSAWATSSGASYVVFGKAAGFARQPRPLHPRRHQRLQAQRRRRPVTTAAARSPRPATSTATASPT